MCNRFFPPFEWVNRVSDHTIPLLPFYVCGCAMVYAYRSRRGNQHIRCSVLYRVHFRRSRKICLNTFSETIPNAFHSLGFIDTIYIIYLRYCQRCARFRPKNMLFSIQTTLFGLHMNCQKKVKK